MSIGVYVHNVSACESPVLMSGIIALSLYCLRHKVSSPELWIVSLDSLLCGPPFLPSEDGILGLWASMLTKHLCGFLGIRTLVLRLICQEHGIISSMLN